MRWTNGRGVVSEQRKPDIPGLDEMSERDVVRARRVPALDRIHQQLVLAGGGIPPARRGQRRLRIARDAD